MTLPTLAGLLRSPEAQQGAVLTATATQSPWYFPSHTELPLWEQTLPKHIPSTERDLRLNWGLKIHKKEQGCTNQCSQADPSPQSPSRPCGCFMPSRPGSANPSSAGSGQSPASAIHGSWNLSYSTTYSTRPSNPPASPSPFKRLFQTYTSVFSNNFV